MLLCSKLKYSLFFPDRYATLSSRGNKTYFYTRLLWLPGKFCLIWVRCLSQNSLYLKALKLCQAFNSQNFTVNHKERYQIIFHIQSIHLCMLLIKKISSNSFSSNVRPFVWNKLSFYNNKWYGRCGSQPLTYIYVILVFLNFKYFLQNNMSCI